MINPDASLEYHFLKYSWVWAQYVEMTKTLLIIQTISWDITDETMEVLSLAPIDG